MGALIPSVYTDFSALRFNGIDKYAYIPNPSFRTDTAGAFSFWFRLPELLTSQGTIPLFYLDSEDSGNNAGYFFLVRRNNGYADPTKNYLDMAYRGTNGATPSYKSGSTPLAANTWYHVTPGSDGKIYLNSAEEVYQRWSMGFPLYTTGWFGGVTATNKAAVIGSNRIGGVVTNYGKVDINDMIYLPGRDFTPAEVSEIHSKGMGADPRLMSFGGASGLMAWDFEKRLTPVIGSMANTFTGVNIVEGDYITP